MENKSGIHPVGRAVLVEPYEPERADSVIVLPPSAKERGTMIEQRATVVEIGPHAWHDEPGPRCKVGDRVLVSAFAGYSAIGVLDNKNYRFINDRDIFALIGDK